MSNTQWSARIESVKPFAEKINEIKIAINAVLELNLASETRSDLIRIKKYMESFECLELAKIWHKVLAAINYRSTVLQARNATIDVEITNLSNLLVELNTIRDSWDTFLNECRLLGTSLQINIEFSGKKFTKRKRTTHELKRTPAEEFRINVFNVFMDSVIGNMTRRFNAANDIDSLFNALWLFRELNDQEIQMTVAQAERSFNMLKKIKYVLRSTMTQNRLNDLGLLSIEAEMAMKINFEEVINLFASRKARKALL
ncbi:uncharacterized protein LOC136079441 [Hydra vulgaris]|uniref:Uncharacterized protein LOC136079441 n=1 Tax=Hydra vulgaris TaxID=6087 RepID=A0ABM4BQ45_HYDVU